MAEQSRIHKGVIEADIAALQLIPGLYGTQPLPAGTGTGEANRRYEEAADLFKADIPFAER